VIRGVKVGRVLRFRVVLLLVLVLVVLIFVVIVELRRLSGNVWFGQGLRDVVIGRDEGGGFDRVGCRVFKMSWTGRCGKREILPSASFWFIERGERRAARRKSDASDSRGLPIIHTNAQVGRGSDLPSLKPFRKGGGAATNLSSKLRPLWLAWFCMNGRSKIVPNLKDGNHSKQQISICFHHDPQEQA
jgi:hypothetical protein